MTKPIIFVKDNIYYHKDLNLVFRLTEQSNSIPAFRDIIIDRNLNVRLSIPTDTGFYLTLDNELSLQIASKDVPGYSKVISNKLYKYNPYESENQSFIEHILALRFSHKISNILTTCYIDYPKMYTTYSEGNTLVFTVVGRTVVGYLCTSIMVMDFDLYIPDKVINSKEPIKFFTLVSHESMDIVKEKLNV